MYLSHKKQFEKGHLVASETTVQCVTAKITLFLNLIKSNFNGFYHHFYTFSIETRLHETQKNHLCIHNNN